MPVRQVRYTACGSGPSTPAHGTQRRRGFGFEVLHEEESGIEMQHMSPQPSQPMSRQMSHVSSGWSGCCSKPSYDTRTSPSPGTSPRDVGCNLGNNGYQMPQSPRQQLMDTYHLIHDGPAT